MACRFLGSFRRGVASNTGMKRLLAVGVVVVALAWLCFRGPAQEAPCGGSGRAQSCAWLGNTPSNGIVIPSPPVSFPKPLGQPPPKLGIRIQIPPPADGCHNPPAPLTVPAPAYKGAVSNLALVPSTPPTIPPGVYRTTPYSCIVVVPGPHPDDKCVVKHGPGDSPMPVVKPDLQFIPLHPPKSQQLNSTPDGHK